MTLSSNTETNGKSPRAVTKAGLRRTIHQHLTSLGFSKDGNAYTLDSDLDKQMIRDIHAASRQERHQSQQPFVSKHISVLGKEFANGDEVIPSKISPEITLVTSGSRDADLFRFATLLWSVPVSQGFGRRLRFLVKDRHNRKLIGLFALGDPVFNLSARDNWIGWTSHDRRERLVHVMDAFVVGAVPPYNRLIGGKLVAGLIGSEEVKAAYERRYLNRESVISGKTKRARLALVTTSSALGRSSLYNRLVIPDGARFMRIGSTRGFGHFHLSNGVFDMMRQYLKQINHPYASGHRYGMGPNWRLRVARAVLDDIGLDSDGILCHGIKREVYAMPLAKNFREILLGKHSRCRWCNLPADEIASYCVKRWMVPRSHRDDRYLRCDRQAVMDTVLDGVGLEHRETGK